MKWVQTKLGIEINIFKVKSKITKTSWFITLFVSMQLLSCQILDKSCMQAFFYIAEAKAVRQTAQQLNS